MKSKWTLSSLLCLLLWLGTYDELLGQRDGFGLGIVVGDPTGLSFKKFVSGDAAFQAAAAWSFDNRRSGVPFLHDRNGSFYFHLDYLKHYYGTLGATKMQIPLYVGIGGFTVLRDRALLGARVPVGIAVHLGKIPLDFFFEAVPTLGIVPSTRFGVGLALGGRFYL